MSTNPMYRQDKLSIENVTLNIRGDITKQDEAYDKDAIMETNSDHLEDNT
jgi:hypothetical protein